MHYHGTPITPKRFYSNLPDRFFCVSFVVGRYEVKNLPDPAGIMLDNGAFSAYTRGLPIDWHDFYDWCYSNLRDERDWCVIPDVIDGGESDNDQLIREFPRDLPGAPVWHLHESLGRLKTLADKFERVCFGSSGPYWSVGSPIWQCRMDEAFTMLYANGRPDCKFHMMRGLGVLDLYPFASADSTNVARSFWVKEGTDDEKHARLQLIRDRSEVKLPPKTWPREGQLL